MKDIIERLDRFTISEFRTLKKYSRKREFYIWLGILALFFFVLYQNTFHEKFTDEFDNILGGVYILHGKLPYIGFFSHHGPFAYFLASFVALFSGNSFVKFRIFYAIFLFLFSLGGYYAVRKSVGDMSSRFYIGFIAIFAIASTYFWGQMLVADSLAAILVAPALAIIILKAMYSIPYRIRDLIIVSILLCLTLLTSLSFSYLIFGAYLFTLIHYFRFRRSTSLYRIIFPFILLGIPWLLFVCYLFITGSFSSFLQQAVIFNQKYYVYNYPRPEGSTSTTINPIRYAIVISFEFYKNFRDLLVQVGSFNFGYPLNITLAIGNLFVLIYLLYRRKYLLFFFMIFLLIFSNPRSNPLTSKETDFQSAVYFILSFLNISFLLSKLWEKLTSAISLHSRVIYTVLFLFLSLYSFYAAAFLLSAFLSKTYNKYMGLTPKIYDRSEYAQIVNAATPENETAWIGPIEFEELLYLDRPIPSKYHILIPGMGRSKDISTNIIIEFNNKKPAVIWFDKRYNILGQSPQDFAPLFINFLNTNYVTFYNEDTKRKEYESVLPIDNKTDIESKLYIRKDLYDQIVNRLLQNNLIRKVEK